MAKFCDRCKGETQILQTIDVVSELEFCPMCYALLKETLKIVDVEAAKIRASMRVEAYEKFMSPPKKDENPLTDTPKQ